jgi:hypothetical protein
MDGGRADTQEQAIGRHCGRSALAKCVVTASTGRGHSNVTEAKGREGDKRPKAVTSPISQCL